MYDTIIIGAGMSGLAAGIRLAHFGQRVCILERHYTIGGLNSFYRLRHRDYDVGLHAVTNFTPKGARKGPLARLLKQLRFQWDDFALVPQRESAIRFPSATLRFGNGLDLLRSEVAAKFPGEREHFSRLVERIADYDDLEQGMFDLSARAFLGEHLRDPLLIEMLLCPLMWYGNARERDMDFGQFCIMFRSIFMEGFARPLAGVRLILRNLVRRYRELGGELRLRSGVARLRVEGQAVRGVELDDKTELTARNVISSAGWIETMRMCDPPAAVPPHEIGRMTFTEAVSILDCPPARIGFDHTIVFYNDSDTFHWQAAESLGDFRTGVICSPNNYLYEDAAAEARLPDGVVRITSIANYDRWIALGDADYGLAKLQAYNDATASAIRFMPDFRRHVIDTDFFTPKTLQRFTWHVNGAVYGATKKRLDGHTHLDNLFICGTDQGFVGIIGAIVSGVSIANQHILRSSAR
ncbi:MAG TPA: NAD(P)/FAD-dependent oxidoreductase [Pirellulaceae bacterium]